VAPSAVPPRSNWPGCSWLGQGVTEHLRPDPIGRLDCIGYALHWYPSMVQVIRPAASTKPFAKPTNSSAECVVYGQPVVSPVVHEREEQRRPRSETSSSKCGSSALSPGASAASASHRLRFADSLTARRPFQFYQVDAVSDAEVTRITDDCLECAAPVPL
jgi:hypothetical protein